MVQSGGFLGTLLGPLLKTRLPLIKNVIKPLAKSILIPLGLTAARSAANAGIHKKLLRSGKPILLGTLGESLLENVLVVKRTNRAGEGIVRTGYGN